MRRQRRHKAEDAELDITSFMNLMIVLVPVLLLSLVFSQVRILNLQLPVTASGSQTEQEQTEEEKLLELVISPEGLQLNYPSGILLKKFPMQQNGQQSAYDFEGLSGYLQDLKLTFQQKKIEKNDIILLLSSEVNYQTIVTAMDTVRSFKAVVAANLVDAELFPNISLGDAPTLASGAEL
jgi:biopolymer transport protein ExbD